MILDVGCGHAPRGHVNVDLFLKETEHRTIDQRQIDDRPLDKKKIPNLVIADAQHLPFKDNSFTLGRSSHLIEHLPNPFLFLKEMFRVAETIKIICPTVYADQCSFKAILFGYARKIKRVHIVNFNRNWFQLATRKLGYEPFLDCRYTSWLYLPHKIFPLFQLPSEITYVCSKGLV